MPEELGEYAQAIPEESALRTTHQYLITREEHLNYARALEQEPPIGSCEVESVQRSVLQATLKKPGAWWKLGNAENMAHLKVMQTHNHWSQFWQDTAA